MERTHKTGLFLSQCLANLSCITHGAGVHRHLLGTYRYFVPNENLPDVFVP